MSRLSRKAGKFVQFEEYGKRAGMEVYFSLMNRYPVLTRDQEYELAQLYVKHRGTPLGKRYRDKLILHNLRYIVKCAFSIRLPPGNPNIYADLVQVGIEAFSKSLNAWEPERGFRILTYCATFMRASMLRFMCNTTRHIRIPERYWYNLSVINRTVHQWRIETGNFTSPRTSITEIASRCNLTEKQIKETFDIFAEFRYEYSLDVRLNTDNDDDNDPLYIEAVDRSSADFYERESLKIVLHYAVQAAPRVSHKVRDVMHWFIDNPESTIKDAAAHFNLRERNVKVIRERMYKKMRPILAKELA